MLKELRSECEITSLALVEHRDLVLIEKTGEVVRIKAEHYLPKMALLNLIKNGEKIIDDFPEEPMPVNHQNSKDVKALTKIYDEPFEERKKNFKRIVSHKEDKDWSRNPNRFYKKKYYSLLEKLRFRNAERERIKQIINAKAIEMIRIKSIPRNRYKTTQKITPKAKTLFSSKRRTRYNA